MGEGRERGFHHNTNDFSKGARGIDPFPRLAADLASGQSPHGNTADILLNIML